MDSGGIEPGAASRAAAWCKQAVRVLAALVLVVHLPAVKASGLSATISDTTGLPELHKGGPAMTSHYVFFGANWAWSHQDAQMQPQSEGAYLVRGLNKNLGLVLESQVRREGERRWTWQWNWTAQRAVPDAVGGGIVFKFDLPAYGRELGEPALLPDRQGWTWGKKGGPQVEMRFEPPLADVFFEQGRKNELRAFFYRNGIAAGSLSHKAVLTVTGGSVQPPRSERFGEVDRKQWPAGLLDAEESPVDLSFLNADDKPAGKRGFVRVEGDRLVHGDGTPARFWGTNIAAYALFLTPKQAVQAQARRLARLGYNLVRIHHHDSPWVNPNIFGNAKAGVTGTRKLDADMLDRLDWWVKCLQDEGIYVWLDLHTQRNLRRDDGIEGFDEISKGKDTVDLKGYNYVNPDIQQAMREFNDAYLNHLNPYTQRRNKDNPAVMAVLLTNENDLTGHFGIKLLPDKKVPSHSASYMAGAEQFAKAKGVAKERAWRAWEPGPGKLYLNDLEYRVNREELQRLRGLGVRVPLVSTSLWGYNGLASLPALTAGDLTDAHAYGKPGELELDPAYKPTLVHWLAAAQLAGRPTTVTEWNMDARLEPDRHTVPLYVAASAAAQGWDAMMHYAYSQEPMRPAGSASVWHGYNDPAITALMPAAALMYRQGHVREATSVYAFAPDREALYNTHITPATSVALRTAVERGKLVVALPPTPELPWLKPAPVPAQAKRIADPAQSLLAAGASDVVSDNGELRRDWAEGLFVVNTPRTQLASGWLGGRAVKTADVTVELDTPQATVAVQGLDGQPVAQSKDILISWAARAVPRTGNSMPFLSEPLAGRLSVGAKPGLKLYIADAQGRLTPAPFEFKNGRYLIDMNSVSSTHWLRLR